MCGNYIRLTYNQNKYRVWERQRSESVAVSTHTHTPQIVVVGYHSKARLKGVEIIGMEAWAHANGHEHYTQELTSCTDISEG
jgi:hypothetical protein